MSQYPRSIMASFTTKSEEELTQMLEKLTNENAGFALDQKYARNRGAYLGCSSPYYKWLSRVIVESERGYKALKQVHGFEFYDEHSFGPSSRAA
jgi:hypothetical protein